MMRGSILHAALQRFYQQLPSAIPGADRVDERNVEAAVALMNECVAQAVETGLRIDAGDLDRRELEQGLQRDLEHSCETRRRRPRRSCRAASRSRSARRTSWSRGCRASAARSTASTATRWAPAASSWTTSPAPPRRRPRSASASSLQLPLYMLVLRDQLGLEPVGGIYVPVGGGASARGTAAGEARTSAAGLQRARLPRDDEFWAQSSARATRRSALAGGSAAATCATTRSGGDCPRVVRALADLPDQPP